MRGVLYRRAVALALAGGSFFAARPAGAQEMTLSAAGMAVGIIELVLLAVTFLAILFAFFASRRRRRAEAFHGEIFAAIPQPRQVVGPRGQILFANPAVRQVFGDDARPVPELLAGQSGAGPDIRSRLEELAGKAGRGEAGHLELPFTVAASAAGEGGAAVTWRHVAAYPLTARPGTVLWVVEDVTLRRQLEEAMRDEQEQMADLLDKAPVGLYSVDGAGRFLFANETFCSWLGVDRQVLEGGEVRLHDILAEAPGEEVPPHTPFAEGEEKPSEVRFDGRRLGESVSAEAEPFAAVVNQSVAGYEEGEATRTRTVVRNLSQERAMAAALERSEARFERFFARAPVGIALLARDGTIAECNDAFLEIARKAREEVVGQVVGDLLAAAEAGEVAAALERTAAVGGEVQAPLEIHFRSGGESGAVEQLGDARISAMYVTAMEAAEEGDDAAQGPESFIAHFIDVTELKTLEAQFGQAQKMQAIGQLAGGMAHDFNNLLTAMIGFSDLLLQRHRPGDQSFADIMQIKQNANRAANLVRQLLAFSRQQTLQPRMLDVTDILTELTHLLRRLIGQSVELEITHGRDLGMVRADQGQLEQVIMNLAVNARDAMAEGGELKIRTYNESVEMPRKSGGETVPPGDYVVVDVADQGSGIAAEHIDRIFEPFFSTKEVGAGTGLGLSTVYGIVKQSGGYVLCRSAPGSGTTFSIYLPYHDPQEHQRAVEGESERKRDLSGSGRLLLVEDEDAVRTFGARVLRAKGYDVTEADSGESALQLLEAEEDGFDLVVTDVVMPRMDGPSLVREIRQRRPEIKVIFISGFAEDEFRQRLDSDDHIHFLPKPFNLRDLAGKVKAVMGEQAEG